MSLKARILDDMKAAMRDKDQPRLVAVRMLRAEIQRREVDEQVELDDEQVLSVVQKMIKQSQAAIEQFVQGNRPDLAEKEQADLDVVSVYLPEPLSDADVAQIIDSAMSETGASSMKDMGQVMALVKNKVQGRADMGKLSQLIKQKLS